MKGPIQLLLFDLGSTLIYENGPWDTFFPRADEALWQVLRGYGVDLTPRQAYGDSKSLFDVYYDDYRNDLSEPTTAAVLGRLLASKGYTLSKEQLREGMRAMYAVTQANWLPEADAVTALDQLRQNGMHIGLISNAADDDNTQALIDKAGVRPHLEYIISSAAFGTRKPGPAIFRSALDYFQMPPGAAVMVGDNFEADIVGAHRAGMQGIWITRRAVSPALGPPEAPADAIVTTLAEIPSLLNQ